MYLSDALRVILRRWWVFLLGMMFTGASTVGVFSRVPTQYQATGQVLLLPPTARLTGAENANPYLSLPDGLTLTAALLASNVAWLDAQNRLEAEGFRSSYSASVLPGTGPLILISVKDTDPSAALAQRDRLLELVTGHLNDLQQVEQVAESQLILARDVSPGSEAEVLAGARLRAAAVVVVLGSVVTIVVTFTVDRLRMRRRVDLEGAQLGSAGRPPISLATSAEQGAWERPGGSVVAANAQPQVVPLLQTGPDQGSRRPPMQARTTRRMRPPPPVPAKDGDSSANGRAGSA